MINGFKKPFRCDRNSYGGGKLVYVISDIPSILENAMFFLKIWRDCIEINLRKSKWLLFGTYHPSSENDAYYFNSVGPAPDLYTSKYDKIILAGDFNAEENEMDLFQIHPLDLILTNCSRSFQNTKAVSTCCSDFHKMVFTILKTS